MDLHKELFLHHQSLHSRLYDFNGKRKLHADYVAKFLTECAKYLQHKGNSADAAEDVAFVKNGCLQMLDEALKQVAKRLQAQETYKKNS